MTEMTALLAWIDGLSKTGLDGHELGQLGLKNGNLTVDDQRSGKRWTFENINLALTRPSAAASPSRSAPKTRCGPGCSPRR